MPPTIPHGFCPALAIPVTVAIAVALASRYPKASALGLSAPSHIRGFNPWGMLSCPDTASTSIPGFI
jgi:hypothetical protein